VPWSLDDATKEAMLQYQINNYPLGTTRTFTFELMPTSGFISLGNRSQLLRFETVPDSYSQEARTAGMMCDSNCNVEFLGNPLGFSPETVYNQTMKYWYTRRQLGFDKYAHLTGYVSIPRDLATTQCSLIEGHLFNQGHQLKVVAYCDSCIPEDPNIPWTPPNIYVPEVHYDFVFKFNLITTDAETDVPRSAQEYAERQIYLLFQQYGLDINNYNIKIDFVFVPYPEEKRQTGDYTGNVTILCVSCDADAIDEIVVSEDMDDLLDRFANNTGELMNGFVTIVSRPSDSVVATSSDETNDSRKENIIILLLVSVLFLFLQ